MTLPDCWGINPEWQEHVWDHILSLNGRNKMAATLTCKGHRNCIVTAFPDDSIYLPVIWKLLFFIPGIFSLKRCLLLTLCFSLLLPAIITQRDLVRALSEQSKYCSTHAEGVSLYADPPVIKQAAAGKSANHRVLQHQVLSGQAAQQAEVCRVCVRTLACTHFFACLWSRRKLLCRKVHKSTTGSKHPPRNKN